jgi:hypothetical protein
MKSARWILLLFATILPAIGSAQIAGGLDLGSGAKHLRFPVGKDPSQPSSLLTIGEVFLQKRNLGPLRLGVLQQTILKGVTVEVLDNPSVQTWYRDLDSFFRDHPAFGAATFDGFCILIPGGARLISNSRSFYSPDRNALIFRDIEIVSSEGERAFHARSDLPLAGADAGYLLLRSPENGKRIRLIPEKQ